MSKESNAVVDQLLQLTREGNLKWHRVRPDAYFLRGRDDIVESYYVTVHKDYRFRLYERRYKEWTDETEFYWTSDVCLETIDEHRTALWTFPMSENLWPLWNAVAYQAADVDQMFKDILGE
jgi:hypothetical protein